MAKQSSPSFGESCAQGDFAQLLKQFNSQITSAGQETPKEVLASLLCNRGYCHLRLHLYRKALKDYDEALALEPSSLEAQLRKGQALVALKKTQDAAAVWQSALDMASPKSDLGLVLTISAALKDPSSVLRECDYASYLYSRVTNPWVLTVLYLLLLLAVHGLARYSFKVASSMLAAPNVYTPVQDAAAALPTPPAAAAAVTSLSSGSKPATPVPSSAGARPSVSNSATPSPESKAKPAAATPATSATSSASDGSKASAGMANGQGGKSGAGSKVETAQQSASLAFNNSVAIQLAVSQINAGQPQAAEELLDKVLASSPGDLGALVARGTARALRRDLKGAVEDFSGAISVEPRYADTWKRRGQARSALGEHDNALQDLQKAIDLLPLWGQDSSQSIAECYVERGMIYQKQRDYRRGCKELREAARLDPHNHQAWNLLGLCSVSQGNIMEGVAAYRKAVGLKPDMKEAWLNMGQALKEVGQIQEAETAFNRTLALDEPGSPSIGALRIMAQMRQQKGEHAAAIRLLDKALGYNKEEQRVELLYLRAICHHALGYVRQAVRDYEACLTYVRPAASSQAPALEDGSSGATTTTSSRELSEEARGFQFLSFYQKELALFMYKVLDRSAASVCLDSEVSPMFKESWCKKGPPTPELITAYTPQPPVPLSPPPPPARPDPEVLGRLVKVADSLGFLLQNSHQGFLPNIRQQRAAGFAALELAQAVRKLVAARREGSPMLVPNEGSTGQPGTSGRHAFGWRDAMDIVVKWRQLSEPADQVVWVDLLTRREFEQGFGSHTPIFSGQTKCVRYYMNFERALALHKAVLLKEGHAFDASNRQVPCGSAAQKEAIEEARTAEDMYKVLRQDSWVVVPIDSASRPGHKMEGTRLTLVKVPNQPDAYEFSIRTPVTPPRWKDFDVELEAAWEAVVTQLAKDPLNAPEVARCAMVFVYYWYNFMPLARGTAACGYTALLSLFWAAGMPVTSSIPKDYQVDWEAILGQSPDEFITSVSPWLYPEQARAGSRPATSAKSKLVLVKNQLSMDSFPDVETLPAVQQLVGTIRERLEALNGEGTDRVV